MRFIILKRVKKQVEPRGQPHKVNPKRGRGASLLLLIFFIMLVSPKAHAQEEIYNDGSYAVYDNKPSDDVIQAKTFLPVNDSEETVAMTLSYGDGSQETILGTSKYPYSTIVVYKTVREEKRPVSVSVFIADRYTKQPITTYSSANTTVSGIPTNQTITMSVETGDERSDISWTPVQGAAYYEVYRNGVLFTSTGSGYFTSDTSAYIPKETPLDTIQVKAFDISGNEIAACTPQQVSYPADSSTVDWNMGYQGDGSGGTLSWSDYGYMPSGGYYKVYRNGSLYEETSSSSIHVEPEVLPAITAGEDISSQAEYVDYLEWQESDDPTCGCSMLEIFYSDINSTYGEYDRLYLNGQLVGESLDNSPGYFNIDDGSPFWEERYGQYELKLYNDQGDYVGSEFFTLGEVSSEDSYEVVAVDSDGNPLCTSGESAVNYSDQSVSEPQTDTISCNVCSKFDQLLAATPPPPNWTEVSNLLGDSILARTPQMAEIFSFQFGETLGDLLGVPERPPSVSESVYTPEPSDLDHGQDIPSMKDMDKQVQFDLTDSPPDFGYEDVTEPISILDPLEGFQPSSESYPVPGQVETDKSIPGDLSTRPSVPIPGSSTPTTEPPSIPVPDETNSTIPTPEGGVTSDKYPTPSF